ncbi:MAG: SDR family NAD(P)-dependent oxidoreductase [Candidatus Dormiibacterota bacterium]
MDVPRRLVGKVAVVTGAGHGIGRASAHRMGLEGARIAVVDLREEEARETASMLKQDGVDAIAWRCDISRGEEVESTIAQIAEQFGRIDILHNNAGVVIAGRVHEVPIEDWDRVFSVNIRGMFLVTRAVLPIMRAQGAGSIVNTASISGIVGEPHLAAYNSSKGAVINFTRHVAVDYARDGIRCNCVCPGWIDTGFNDPIFIADKLDAEGVRLLVEQDVPMNRQGTAEEVAPAVAFLASDDAAYITGHPLVVDGGQMAL